MKKLFALLLLLCLIPVNTMAKAPAVTQSSAENPKALVVFFSRPGENYSGGEVSEGNTKIVAKMFRDALKSDLMEIVPVNPYPATYDETVERFKKERDANLRPEIKVNKDVKGYDIIFLGYPIWGGQLPLPVVTWLESVDLQGKTIVPFSTHGGSELARTPEELRSITKGAEIKDGFAVYGQDAQNLKENTRKAIRKWLKEQGYLK